MDIEQFTQLSDNEKRLNLIQLRDKFLKFVKSNKGRVLDQAVCIDKDNQYQDFPLTEIQESFLVGKYFTTNADNVGCHIYLEFDVKALNIENLKAAWHVLLVQHSMLRAMVYEEGKQRVIKDLPQNDISFSDVSVLESDELQKYLLKIRGDLSHKVYKPNEWPLYTIHVSQLTDELFRVHFSIDEWIVDGASVHLLLSQWCQLYYKNDYILPVLNLSFRDYVFALEQLKKPEKHKQDLDYWLKKLDARVKGPDLLNNSVKSDKKIQRFRLEKVLKARVWSVLKDKIKKTQASPTTFLLSVFCQVLHSFTRQKDFSLVMTYFNRLPISEEVDKIVGPFISTNIFLSHLDESSSLSDFLEDNQHQLWEDLDHAGVSGVEVLRTLKNDKKIDSTLSLPVVFTSMLGNVGDDLDTKTWLDNISYAITQTPQVYLDHQTFERHGELYITWDYAKEVFPASLIENMLDAYFQCLSDLAKDNTAWSKPISLAEQACKVSDASLQQAVLEQGSEHRYDGFPLNEIQQAYFVGRSAFIDGDAVSCQFYQEINVTDVVPRDIEAAWNHLIQTHDALKSVITDSGEQIVQKLTQCYTVRIESLKDKTNEEQESALGDIRDRMVNHVFPIGQWPFFDVMMSCLPENKSRIHLAIDLMIADGNSVQLLIEQFVSLLNNKIQINPPSITYRDYRTALPKQLDAKQVEVATHYWKQKLQLLLPGPQFINTKYSHKQARVRQEAMFQDWCEIKRLIQKKNIPASYVLLTAFADVLLAWNERKPFTLVVVNWDRPAIHPEIQDIIGDFTSLSWLTVESNQGSFMERVQHNYESVQDDLRHSCVSGLSILRNNILSRSRKTMELPSVVYTQMPLKQSIKLSSQVELGFGLSQTPQVNLDCMSLEVDECLHLHWDRIEEAIDVDQSAAMFQDYQDLLEKLAKDIDCWESSVYFEELAGEKTCSKISLPLTEWNETYVDYGKKNSLCQLIETATEQYGTATALVFGDLCLTYSELNRRANQWAHYFRQLGLNADQPVALVMERGIEMVVALIAILKAGGAYLPIDVEYPEERINYIQHDAKTPFILIQEKYKHKVAFVQKPIMCLDTETELVKDLPQGNLPTTVTPTQLAYVIYTSGSTGEPNGCMISHASICNRLLWMRDQYQVKETDRILQKTPYTFDVSVWELFLPLISGAVMVLAKPHGHQDVQYLVDTINEKGVTLCHFVPSMLGQFLSTRSAASCTSIKKIFTSGEALPYELMVQCLDTLPAELHNLYGPTEAAVDVSHWHCKKNSEQLVPIGTPIANTQIYILDEHQNPVAIGTEGELCIGGVQLAQGYLNKATLTAKSFVKIAIEPDKILCLYKTGDRARYLQDGNIEYLGRQDFQVKLRGLRIELGEIENALRNVEDVNEAIVLVRDQDLQDPKLVAYLCTTKAQTLSLKDVRDTLRHSLPEYMLPNAIVPIEEMPTTKHGKLDRAALPWPPSTKEDINVVVEEGNAKQIIKQAITRYLEAEMASSDIDPGEDLFDLGVTSLTLVRISQKIFEHQKVKVPVEVFLDKPTINAISAYVAAQKYDIESQVKEQNVIAQTPMQDLKHIPLPDSNITDVVFHDFAETADFIQETLTLSQLSQWLGVLKQHRINNRDKYLYPSGGGKNAVQTYLYVQENAIEGLDAGVYYYHPIEHALMPISSGQLLNETIFHPLYQATFKKSSLCLFLIAQRAAIVPFYADTATTLIELDAGYMTQRLIKPQDNSLIGVTSVVGVDFERVRQDFKLDPSHEFLHCLMAGAINPANGKMSLEPELASLKNKALLSHHAQLKSHRSLKEIKQKNKAGEYSTLSKEILDRISKEQPHIRKMTSKAKISLPEILYNTADYLLRSCQRDFQDKPVPLSHLSQLLSLIQPNAARSTRLYPSTANRYSVDAYVYVKTDGVECLSQGIYRYRPEQNELVLIEQDDSLDKKMKSCHVPFNRTHYGKSKFTVFLIADVSELTSLYGDYGIQLAFYEAGHIGQLFMDHQSEMELGVCPIGGMRFHNIESHFHLNDQQLMLHSFVCGPWQHRGQLSRPIWQHSQQGVAANQIKLRETPLSFHHNAQQDIAIIGLSGRYPGAENPDELWQLLKEGKSAISSVPSSRWNMEDYYHPDVNGVKSYSKWGGFIKDIDAFDSLLFKISPMEAQLLDPQERLFLEVVWECLENAGYTSEVLRNHTTNVGVFVGVMWNDYQNVAMDGWSADNLKKTFSFHSSIANRVSYYFDFQGPSIAIDSSCSSTLSALHLAVESLRRGECEAAIVGGVNLLAHPYHQNNLCGLNLLSQSDKSAAFSADGSGWIPGEGVGAILIRSLAKAEVAKDYIHGVIKATSITHSGRTPRYGMPSSDNQSQSIAAILQKADLKPSNINYIESAAAGATLADASEVDALKKVFTSEQFESKACAMGSVKPNIGHLESASFMSQLTKVLLQMRHKILVPSIDCEPINPLLQLEQSPLYVNREVRPWQYDMTALINGFGATGSNGHAVITSYASQVDADETKQMQIFVLSAASGAQLRLYAKRLYDFLLAQPRINLSALSHTLQRGRMPMGTRLAVVTENYELLVQCLLAYHNQRLPYPAIHYGEVSLQEAQNFDLNYQDLQGVAKNWVKGCEVDWTVINNTQQKIPLPTYPFDKQKHWLQAPSASLTEHSENTNLSMQKSLEQAQMDLDDNVELLNTVETHFKKMYARLSGISLAQIDVNTPLIDYGINSLLITSINNEIAKTFSHVSKTVLFECQTLRELAKHFIEHHYDEVIATLTNGQDMDKANTLAKQATQHRTTDESNDNDPIAIVGLSGRYPKANDMETFWQNLVEAEDCITDVPSVRWDTKQYGLDKCWGGFIENADSFDPLFFNISPTEAKIMDPQERLFLEVSWEAVEDAGYTRQSLQQLYDGHVGVFVGVMYGEYQLYGAEQALKGNPIALGSAYGSIANRVSYCLNINGPSMAIDTLCSSSLTCAHMAVESIRRGECDMAIVGGVNLSLHPNKYLLHSQMNMTASDGRCHSFGEGGDGFVPGEGVGAIVLKRLSEAERDGDHIYSVIASTAVNHDGKTNGYTVPNPQQHGALIKQALTRAKIDPRDISYIEAHGTGTALGDPIEITGLIKAFKDDKAEKQFCSIGSVKSNIGHLESAAGIASISKVLLQMKHKTLVPSLHAETLNSNIDFENSPFFVQNSLMAWEPSTKGNRLAGVSSFGAGGANAHIILQEYSPEPEVPIIEDTQQLFLLSAKNPQRLEAYIKRWHGFLDNNMSDDTDLKLSDITYTLQVGREHMDERLTIVVNSLDQLRQRLAQLGEGRNDDENIIRGNSRAEQNDWLLSGNETAEIVDVLIKHANLVKLARLWVSGSQIDWMRLYEGVNRPHRISLPFYPFEKKSYWVTSTTSEQEEPIQPSLHALIDANVSTLKKIAYTKHIAKDVYFKRVDSKTESSIVPGSLIIQMACVALNLANENKGISHLSDLTWSEPVFKSDENLNLTTKLYPDTTLQQVQFEIHNTEQTCLQGTAHLGLSETSMGSVEYLDIEAIKKNCRTEIDTSQIMSTLQQQHRIFDQEVNTLVTIFCSNSQMLVDIDIPKPNKGMNKMDLVIPVAIDTGLQTLSYMLGAKYQDMSKRFIPYGAERIGVPTDNIDIKYLYLKPCEHCISKDNEDVAYDVTALSSSGKVVMKISACLFKPVEVSAGTNFATKIDAAQVSYKSVQWQAAPLHMDDDLPSSDGATLLFDTNRSLLKALNKHKASQTGEIYLVKPAKEYLWEDDHVIRINPALADHVKQLFSDLQEKGVDLHHILHCWSKEEYSIENQEKQLANGLYSVLDSVKALIEQKPSHTITFFFVYTTETDQSQPCYAAVNSFLKTATYEFPLFKTKTIKVEKSKSLKQDELVTLLEQERQQIYFDADDIQYRDNQREIKTFIDSTSQHSTVLNVQFKKGGTYLITGGLGGLGRLCATYLAKTYQANLILCGRSVEGGNSQKILNTLSQLGAEAIYVQSDITELTQAKALVETAKQHFSQINGIIHTAGVLQDAYISNKNREQIKNVIAPKVMGTQNLDEALSDTELDVFILFSSIVGIMGNIGQSDYAYANGFLDHFAAYRNERVKQGQRNGKTLSINWPLWRDGVMTTDDVTKAWMTKEFGLIPLNNKCGLQALESVLNSPSSQQIVVVGNDEKINERLNIVDADSFNDYQRLYNRHPVIVVSQSEVVADTPQDKVETTAKPDEKNSAAINQFLRVQLAEVTGIAIEDIEKDSEFWEMGLDSILAMKIIEKIEAEYGLRLYPNEMIEYNNLEKLTRYLNGEIEELNTNIESKPESSETPSMGTPVIHATPEAKPLVFVLSTPRAGSTLLRAMMAGHSSIFAPPELHLLPYDTLQQWDEGLQNANQKHLCEGFIKALAELEKTEGQESIARVQALQSQDTTVPQAYALLQILAKGQYVVDKSPSYGLDLAVLKRAEQVSQEPFYIHLVRHPISVMESFVRNRFNKLFAVEGDAWEFADEMWCNINTNIETFLSDIPQQRKIQIQYEQLVTHPQDNMQEICQFLSLPFEEGVLTPYAGGRMIDGLHGSSMPIGDPNFLNHNKIKADYATNWKKHQDKFEKLTQKTLSLANSYGYTLIHQHSNSVVELSENIIELKRDQVEETRETV